MNRKKHNGWPAPCASCTMARIPATKPVLMAQSRSVLMAQSRSSTGSQAKPSRAPSTPPAQKGRCAPRGGEPCEPNCCSPHAHVGEPPPLPSPQSHLEDLQCVAPLPPQSPLEGLEYVAPPLPSVAPGRPPARRALPGALGCTAQRAPAPPGEGGRCSRVGQTRILSCTHGVYRVLFDNEIGGLGLGAYGSLANP